MLIAIEGADGVGKTSVAEAVAKKIDARVLHFPDDLAYSGPAIRSRLRQEWEVMLNPHVTLSA